MRREIAKRLDALEAARRPPEPVWVSGVDWMCNGRIVARTPGYYLEPGEGFSWGRCLAEIARAHEQMAHSEDDWGEDLIGADEDDDL